MTLEEYLDLTDEQVQFLVAYEYGFEINNPKHGSAVDPKENPEELITDEDPLEGKELDELTDQEKVDDLDSPQED